jgi:polyisoprenoid-binding protein YceI
VARFKVVPERSRLRADARSTLHPVRVETAGLHGDLAADVDGGDARLQAPFTVEIDAERLRSGNSLIDGELKRRLETRRFPRVFGEVQAVEPVGPGRFVLRGALTLHGVTRPSHVEVVVRAVDDRTLEIEGEKIIDMRDHALEPPRLFFLRVQPAVRIWAKLVAVRS